MANLLHFSHKTSVAIARKLALTKKADVIGKASKTPIKTMVFQSIQKLEIECISTLNISK
jgi:hypothetical protein